MHPSDHRRIFESIPWPWSPYVISSLGIIVGLAGGLYLSGFVKGLLHEVHPTDALSIAMPTGCLLLTAFLAVVPAARRAARLDPIEALRSE